MIVCVQCLIEMFPDKNGVGLSPQYIYGRAVQSLALLEDSRRTAAKEREAILRAKVYEEGKE